MWRFEQVVKHAPIGQRVVHTEHCHKRARGHSSEGLYQDDCRTRPVLVNAQGRTLYTFAPDKDKQVTCVGGCAAVWPPAVLSNGQKALGVGLVKQSLLGSDANPAGGRVITYAGWPVYTYVTDTSPGKASGQALNINGGLWYVISPSGKVITTKP